ncbi:MAG: hypothetical protein Q9226_001735 [Calogaya cf. arnoldii]
MSANPTATLDPKDREAINKGLMDQQTLSLLQDAGEACKQARAVAGPKPVRKPVGPPVSKDTTDSATKDKE